MPFVELNGVPVMTHFSQSQCFIKKKIEKLNMKKVDATGRGRSFARVLVEVFFNRFLNHANPGGFVLLDTSNLS